MYRSVLLTLSISSLTIDKSTCNLRGIAKSLYKSPKSEKNYLNTGVWIKNNKYNVDSNERHGKNSFFFNNLDNDGNFNGGGTEMLNAMQYSGNGGVGFIQRKKRSSKKQNYRTTNLQKPCLNKDNCILDGNDFKEETPLQILDTNYFLQSKVGSDYLKEFAFKSNNDKQQSNISPEIEIKKDNNNESSVNIVPIEIIDKDLELILNDTTSNYNLNRTDFGLNDTVEYNVINAKRHAKKDEANLIKHYDLEGFNTKSNLVERDVVNGDGKSWELVVPSSQLIYKYTNENNNKKQGDLYVTNEKVLTRVLALLTKTFKKIMKQHEDIKSIYDKFNRENVEFSKSMTFIMKRFKEFETKFRALVEMKDKLLNLERHSYDWQKNFALKEKELTKNYLEFGKQQQKFLIQQKQFYDIQKIILSQNEKIMSKQSLISEAQTEMNNKQTNFAKALKRLKQLYVFNKNNKLKNNTVDNIQIKEEYTPNNEAKTHSFPDVGERVKINLFSIPVLGKIENQDHRILNEKDYYNIDDLVYKFYFNNTFIDKVIKSGLLADVVTNENEISEKNQRNAFNKKVLHKKAIKEAKKKTKDDLILNELKVKNKSVTNNTILQPRQSNSKSLRRKKRWITHFSRLKSSKKSHRTTTSQPLENTNTPKYKSKSKRRGKGDSENGEDKSDPYKMMATNFCNQIGQNINKQMLKWCIEKAIRRLQSIDSNLQIMAANDKFPKSDPKQKVIETTIVTTEPTTTTAKEVTETTTPIATTEAATTQNVTTEAKTDLISMFFPDNDELESKLKQFDLKPDTEGTIYFDGSLHNSDLGNAPNSDDGKSDILPGMDSNSKADLDPLTLDMQAQRRAYVKRVNDKLLNKIARGQIPKLL